MSTATAINAQVVKRTVRSLVHSASSTRPAIPQASSSLPARYSTVPRVSSMNASSREAR